MDKMDYYLYVKGKAVKVSEEVYKAYWKINQIQIKNIRTAENAE